jgi:hypothetical protein
MVARIDTGEEGERKKVGIFARIFVLGEAMTKAFKSVQSDLPDSEDMIMVVIDDEGNGHLVSSYSDPEAVLHVMKKIVEKLEPPVEE